MMKTLLLYTTVVIELCWTGKVSSSSCQVYPSEYAYHSVSVYRSERNSANCRSYPEDVHTEHAIFTQFYIHCNGTHLRLTDSDLGSDQYSSSDYYVWTSETGSQLLFVFPTRVNLTTITLHYYSDSVRGLPRLIFRAVPDDFEVWHAPSVANSHVDIAAVPPGGELAGRMNVSVNANFSTKKVLMYKYRSDFAFAMSEVEFFIYCSKYTYMYAYAQLSNYETVFNFTTASMTKYSINLKTKSFTPPVTTSTQSTSCTFTQATATTLEPTTEYSSQRVNTLALSISEVVAWVLVSILTVLFTGLLTVIVLWLYKKRQSRDIDERAPKYEIEGNPCYEATGVKQTTDVETHVYEAVRGGGAK